MIFVVVTIFMWKKPLSILSVLGSFPLVRSLHSPRNPLRWELPAVCRWGDWSWPGWVAWPTFDSTSPQSPLFFPLGPWLRSTQTCSSSERPKVLMGKINDYRRMWINSTVVIHGLIFHYFRICVDWTLEPWIFNHFKYNPQPHPHPCLPWFSFTDASW